MQKINPCIQDQRLAIIEKYITLGTQKNVPLHFEEEKSRNGRIFITDHFLTIVTAAILL